MRDSFTGAIERPQQILEGGYLTYNIDRADSALYQWHDGADEDCVWPTSRSSRAARRRCARSPTRARYAEAERRRLQPAGTVYAADRPLRGVDEAARGAALNTAEAVYLLTRNLG